MVAGITEKELIQIAFIVVGSYVVVRLGKFFIRRTLRKTYKEDGNKEAPITGLRFLYNTLSFLVYTIAIMAVIYSIPPFKSIGKALFAGAGIFAAIIGFASQQAFSNIIGGVFLVVFKPFKVGDLIRVGTINEGHVEDITLRHTVICDFDNKRIIIPNSTINNEVIVNASLNDHKIMNRIEFGISYDSNLAKAEDIIRSLANEHSLTVDNRTQDEINSEHKKIDIRVIRWADSSIVLRAYIWTNSQPEGFLLRTDLYRSVKLEFDNNGIEIPFPHRTLVYKNNEKKETN
jgi:small conductance mechanosensitive channel